MSDLNKPGDKAEGSVEKKSVLLQGRVTTDVSRDERNDALSMNPNKSDGSLQKYADKPLARSIEIHAVGLDGKPVKIDKTSLHNERSLSKHPGDEADAEAKAQKKKHERISRSVMMLAYEARKNPVMEPVHLAREYAEKLPDSHPDKLKLTEMARHQAAEYSHEMRDYYDQKSKGEQAGETGQDSHRSLNKSKKEEPLQNNFEGWQKLLEKIDHLTPDQKMQLALGLAKEQQKIEREKAIGGLVGTVQGAESLVMDACNFFQFAGECLIYPDKANAKIEKFSQSLWNAGVAGVQLLEMGALYGAAYTGDVVMAGDLSKPLKDAYKLGQFLEKDWDGKTPFEQERLKYKFATEVLGNMIPIGTSAKLAKADTVADIFKVMVNAAKEQGVSLEKGAEAFTRFIKGFARFRLGPELQPATGVLEKPSIANQIKELGKELKEKFDEFSAQMGRHKGDQPNKPGKGKYHYEDQGPPKDYKYWRPGAIDIMHIKEQPFVKDVLAKIAKHGAIDAEDGKKVCDVIAESLRSKCPDIDKRNIAFGVLTKNGKQEIFIGISKKQGLPGIVGESIDKLLPTKRAGDIDVSLHSEYKILETVRKLLEKESGGTFALFTEQEPCRSCEPAIEAFRKMFNGKRGSKGNVEFGKVSWKYGDQQTRLDWNLLRTDW